MSMNERVKQLLGPELAAQVEAALKGKGSGGADLELVTGEELAAADQKLSDQEKTHKAQLLKLQRQSALRLGLAGKAHDPEDVIALLDLDKIQLDDKGALKQDLEELTKPIREKKPYLFVEEKPKDPPAITGVKPAEIQSQQPSAADELAAWRAEAGL